MFLATQVHTVLKSLLSSPLLASLDICWAKQRTHSEMMMLPDPHVTGMSAVWSGRCEVVPVISNRGSQWGSMTDSYESESAASTCAVLLFRNAYYKCHLSALPGSLPSLQHAGRDAACCFVPCYTPQPCFLPTVLGERRDSVISTCTSSGPIWRISTGCLMLGLFNISEFQLLQTLFYFTLRLSPDAYCDYLQLLPA